MRVITKQMCDWIESSIKTPWEPGDWNNQSNTSVYRRNKYTEVRLFGNTIASIEQPNGEDIYHSDIYLYLDWNTHTTLDRLNGILSIFTKSRLHYHDNNWWITTEPGNQDYVQVRSNKQRTRGGELQMAILPTKEGYIKIKQTDDYLGIVDSDNNLLSFIVRK